MELGIIGLPTSGKTTVFNALTRSNHPTAAASMGKMELHRAIVEVPDERVDRLSALFKPRKTTYAKVTYLDIAGLDKGISASGISGQLRNQIATVDAFVHVVRAFESDLVPHPLESVDPQRDLDLLHSEMLLVDLISVTNRLERIAEGLQKGARGEERARFVDEEALFTRLREALEIELPLRALEFTAEEQETLRGFGLLTLKPTLVLLNTDEENADPAEMVEYAHPQTVLLALPGKLEMEIAQLSPEERALFMEEFGIEQSGLRRVIQTSYELLELLSFFTVSEEEVRAWTLQAGETALDAAATIHTDLARGFIRAEVIPHDELLAAGGMSAARKAGLLRLEGKEYVVQDGDIVHIRFSV
ncbi:MAG: redox-regulated ATPase YchF [Anaerolineales bacterium]